LVGELPFVAATELELYRLHTEAVFPSVRTKRPDLPPALDDIIARACAKDRRDRYSTCEELDAALVQAGLHTMRSVPPTVMATQGLPSVPPPAPDGPRGSSTSRVARTLSDAPIGAPLPGTPLPGAPLLGGPLPGSSVPPFVALPPAAAGKSARSVWKVVALLGGLLVVLAGAGLGWAFATGVFDEPRSPLVEPPAARDAGAVKTPIQAPPRADAGKPSR